ncbi:hypothetical protein ACP70R_034455 [Stipagrostis hirtigluma subsp. patula]
MGPVFAVAWSSCGRPASTVLQVRVFFVSPSVRRDFSCCMSDGRILLCLAVVDLGTEPLFCCGFVIDAAVSSQ